jgi:hypothetical protein
MEWNSARDSLTEMVRARAQMVCFANSYAPLYPNRQWDHDGDRGWAQTAMWAHFAERHAGVCLEFDKETFLDDLKRVAQDSAIVLTGDVVYHGSGDQPITLPNLAVNRIKDATAERMFSHVVHNAIAAFFRKDACWTYEQEFRAVALNTCGDPIYVPIHRSLRRVILGDAFPAQLRPVLKWILAASGIDAKIEYLTPPFGFFTNGPYSDKGPDEEVSREVGPEPFQASPNGEHSHDESCKPEMLFRPSKDDRLGIWRDTLIYSYRRRLSRSLEQVSAELSFAFAASRRVGILRQSNNGSPMDVDNFSIAPLPGVGSLEIRLATPLRATGSPDDLILCLEIDPPGSDPTVRQWDVTDDLPDTGILEIFREIDSLVNNALSLLAPHPTPSE